MRKHLIAMAMIAALIAVSVFVATAATVVPGSAEVRTVAPAAPSPVTNFLGQAYGIIAIISMIAGLVGGLFGSNAKVKAATDKVQAEANHLQTQLASIPPEVSGACDLFFAGVQGRQMGAQAGIAYLAKQHANDPLWQLGATQIAALVDHFGPMLAKIKV